MIKGSPYEAPMPAILFLSKQELGWMFLRLNPQMPVREALAKMETVFKAIVPSTPFAYQFMDEAYDAKFKAEERIGQLVLSTHCLKHNLRPVAIIFLMSAK